MNSNHFYPNLRDKSLLGLPCPLSSQIDDVKKLRNLVKTKAKQRDYLGAINILNQLIQLNHSSAIDYNNRGLMHLYTHQFLPAMLDFNQAIYINPQLDSAYNNRGNCYVALENLAAAIMDYQIAIELNPTNLKAWINQGITFRDIDLYDLAIDNFKLVLELSHTWQGRVYGERGRTYHLRGDWNCAIADYYRALKESYHQHYPYQEQVKTWLNELLEPICY